ncbi:MAG TPA: ankyrin repeat domain-containing protein [Pyrinomonadaceae bacterium]|jgi:ankyrin repeat protein/mono/diheme cytochrome c family protein|nr:ankyrin repeat domain-containing protein [Pyrinomonadaceae bacterium]
MYFLSSSLAKRLVLVAVVAALALSMTVSHRASGDTQTKLPPAASRKVDYLQDIKPLLAQKCYSCHGPEVQQAGLRLDLRQNALRGGDYGPVIKIGDSAASKLIRRIVDGDGGMQMPPTGPLSDEEIGLLRAWIDQGAEFRTDIITELPRKPVDPNVTALIAAVRAGNRREIERQIATTPNAVQGKDDSDSTPLHHAAGYGPLENVELLLSKGADVNAKNRRASTPLHWAMHDVAKVRLLLSKGADVNAKQVQGRTPLFLAAMLGDGVATIRLLLSSGADPNLASANGQTPLMMAAARGNVEAMRLLIEKGAAVNHRDGAGETALMSAGTSGSADAVRFLIEKGADVKIKSKRNETALGFAATSGVQASVELLLSKGADVNVRNFRGYSPLMFAASSDTMPAGIIRLLLDKGADVSFTGDYDEPASALAAKRGHTEVARLLGAEPVSPTVNATIRVIPIGISDRSIPNAVTNSLALLAKQSNTFIRTAGCNSCHSQSLPSAALGQARDHGLTSIKTFPQLPSTMTPPPEQLMDFIIVSPSIAWELFDAGMNHQPRTQVTDAIVRYLMASQTAEGTWRIPESRRPPMNSGSFQTAALAIYALKNYAPETEKPSCEKAISRSVAWLEKATPVTNQDHAFRLLGLAWGGASASTIREEVKSLATLQRADGGWNQLPAMASDAYATGEALYALGSAGRMAITDPVFRKGVYYLLSTQAGDGSWHVTTRSIWLQPYLESGFPYGRDQFISTAGTGWATLALAFAGEAAKQSRR